jgi:hypothetical protein
MLSELRDNHLSRSERVLSFAEKTKKKLANWKKSDGRSG